MTDLTSLGLETTAEEREAVPTWRAINGDSPFMARFLRDFDKLAAEVTRLLALIELTKNAWAAQEAARVKAEDECRHWHQAYLHEHDKRTAALKGDSP